ncbi:MAG: hypothetical protein M3463_12930, partial [Verrucomicrobiota bacterium]|nr:hypothetical protein [Verrucomicrobiota bacterium]
KFKPEEITSLEVTRQGQPTIALQRDKENAWKPATGDEKVNPGNVQSLINTLAGLRAVRWAGATTPEHGLDTPEVIVAFKTTGNASGKLTVGAKTPDELWHAGADGFTGTFLASRPDVEALQLALIDKPAPAAGPAPAATDPAAPVDPAAPTPGAPAPRGAAAPPAPSPAAPAQSAPAPGTESRAAPSATTPPTPVAPPPGNPPTPPR